jgi:chitin disaccharide deacetylase
MINPVLHKLGFAADDRVVLLHVDDVGMCGASVDAFLELAGGELRLSGSAMVPCAGFAEVAARCRDCDDVDIGVHLTLTSEWDGYRWGPITKCDRASGLIDDEGYLHRNQNAWTSVDRAAARAEIEAQVDRALAAGIDVTHVDTHMCACLHPCLVDDYLALGPSRGVPVLVTRQPGWLAALSPARVERCERVGLPVFDDFRMLALDEPAAGGLERAKRAFEELAPGMTVVVAHPAVDTPELRAIAPDWRQRVEDFEALRDARLARHVSALGVELIDWRALRELVRGDRRAAPAAGAR